MTNRQFPGNFGKFRRRTAEYVVLAVALIQGVLTAPAQSRVMNQPPSNEVIYARPEIAAALAEHYEALGGTEPRNLDRIGRGHLLRDPRHGLDTLTGISFGESKRSRGFNNRPGTFDEIDRSAFDDFGKRDSDGLGKRNIDEIDRTGFDSFVKRNLDEIDRAGWNGLLKRDLFEAYPRDRLH
ncbi:orcokinin peptides type A isoform X3 [Orussus abietinus]|uniref:orcokinin peptides type A isoform X3 n=1 Tax=Orussus abietinus TaxID=222816 RepID=UPI0006268A39|nr:orcokinin peptides type A isoform X3 [Orussus abietinus]